MRITFTDQTSNYWLNETRVSLTFETPSFYKTLEFRLSVLFFFLLQLLFLLVGGFACETRKEVLHFGT